MPNLVPRVTRENPENEVGKMTVLMQLINKGTRNGYGRVSEVALGALTESPLHL